MERKRFLFMLGAAMFSLQYQPEAFAQSILSSPNEKDKSDKFQAPQFFKSGDPSKPYVYLTIDDDWYPNQVEKAIQIANDNAISLTFYPAGTAVQKDPWVWREVYASGHAIENHTYTHPHLGFLGYSRILWEIQMQHDAVQNALQTEYTQHFLRPPWGEVNQTIISAAAQLGFKTVTWSCDSKGWVVASRTDQQAQNYILSNINDNLTPGAIILQHGVPSDISVLADIIERIRVSGLRAISMPNGIS